MFLDTLREALEAAVVQVLEEAAFAFTEPASDQGIAPVWPREVVRAQLPFDGPINGTFSLAAPSSLCSTIAADMTGEADDIGGGEEVLGEILNMAVGIALERSLSGQGQWELGIPAVERISSARQTDRPQPDVRIQLLTEEEEPIEATFSLERNGQ